MGSNPKIIRPLTTSTYIYPSENNYRQGEGRTLTVWRGRAKAVLQPLYQVYTYLPLFFHLGLFWTIFIGSCPIYMHIYPKPPTNVGDIPPYPHDPTSVVGLYPSSPLYSGAWGLMLQGGTTLRDTYLTCLWLGLCLSRQLPMRCSTTRNSPTGWPMWGYGRAYGTTRSYNIVAHTRTAYLPVVPACNNSYTATPDQHNRVVPLYPPHV